MKRADDDDSLGLLLQKRAFRLHGMFLFSRAAIR
jgi:hypothetical protein